MASNNTLDWLLKQIDFSADNVVEAAVTNPNLFLQASNYRLKCLRSRNAAKMSYERVQAEKELEIREDLRVSGDKVTEAGIKARLLLDPDVEKSQKIFSKADELEEYSKLIVEVFRMRRECLKIVGDLTREEISLGHAVEAGREKLEENRQRAAKRFPKGE